MRFALGIPFVLALAACGGPAAESQEASNAQATFTPELHTGVIKTCHDGDTCVALLDGTNVMTKIRLAGIDAPETSGGVDSKGQPLGKEARDFLNKRLKGKTVQVSKTDDDMYGRVVAEIRLGGELVNEEMVDAGYAEAYKHARNVNKAMYAGAQKKAKEAKKGVWALDAYQSPSDFRREEKVRIEQPDATATVMATAE